MSSVSIIIPVYNVEEYLDKCVESVVNQSFRDIEVILVDDGSTDTSGSICDSWAEKDDRVKVIHNPNGGLAEARNCGTQIAKGEWLLYLDSDDWYEKANHIELLVNQADSLNSDVVCFNYKRFYTHKGSFSAPAYKTDSKTPSAEYLTDKKIYTSSACSKLIKRSLVAKNGLHFEKGRLSEDIEFSGLLLLLAQNITFCPDAFLVYRSRSNSITASMSKKHVSDLIYIVKKLSEYQNRTPAFNSYLAFQYCTILINAHLAKVDKATFQEIFNLKWLLKYDSGLIVKLVHTLSRITGIRVCSYILYLYFKYFLNRL